MNGGASLITPVRSALHPPVHRRERQSYVPSPVSPSDHVSPRAALPAAQYAASRHAAWLGAAAIITDEAGRVLLVHPTYRKDDSWLLPGGVVEPGEHPHVTCRREI